MDILSKYFESTEKANILTEYIDENREVTEKRDYQIQTK